MPEARGYVEQDVTHSPTLIETQLDSIALQLCRIKYKVESDGLLDHLTEAEREKLNDALHRAEQNLHRLGESVRGE